MYINIVKNNAFRDATLFEAFVVIAMLIGELEVEVITIWSDLKLEY